MDAQTLGEHATELRAYAHRNGGSIGASQINQWISEHGLRNDGGLNERKLLELAGLAEQLGNGGGYVVVSLVPPLEERRQQQMAEAATWMREQLARGPIPTQEFAFPTLRFPLITLDDAMKAVGAARILNAGISECYALLPRGW